MEEVGKKFETGDYYIGELMFSARMFEIAASMLEPLAKGQRCLPKPLERSSLAPPKGMCMILGKNIFKVMAQAGGFEVVDLGIDVPAGRFLEAVEKEEPADCRDVGSADYDLSFDEGGSEGLGGCRVERQG